MFLRDVFKRVAMAAFATGQERIFLGADRNRARRYGQALLEPGYRGTAALGTIQLYPRQPERAAPGKERLS